MDDVIDANSAWEMVEKVRYRDFLEEKKIVAESIHKAIANKCDNFFLPTMSPQMRELLLLKEYKITIDKDGDQYNISFSRHNEKHPVTDRVQINGYRQK